MKSFTVSRTSRGRTYRWRFGGHHRLIISFRFYRLHVPGKGANRRELAIYIPGNRLKEIALGLTKYGAKPKNRRPRVKRLIWAKLPSLLVLAGMFGSGYFTNQIISQHALLPPQTFTALRMPTAQPATHPQPAIKPLPPSVPTAIAIPSVNINVPLVPVGQAPGGIIQMPPLFAWEAGWYDKSPTPGQLGPSVIVGHVDNYKTISVFWRLRYVHQGAAIIVTRADGTRLTFTVNALVEVSQSNFPTQVVYGNTDSEALRIITCGGAFNTATGSYEQNTVVFATLSSVAPATTS